MANDIMQTLDLDRDGILSKEEFAKEPLGESTDPQMDLVFKKLREREFDTDVDSNQDGVATLEELLNYVNPKNERHAMNEVIWDLGVIMASFGSNRKSENNFGAPPTILETIMLEF